MINRDTECADFQKVHAIMASHTERLILQIDKKSMHKAAKELGRFFRGALRFQDQKEMVAAFDYCIHFPDPKLSPIEREMKTGGYDPQGSEFALLDARRRGYYSVYRGEEADGECRCLFRDLVTGRAYRVLDQDQVTGGSIGGFFAAFLVPIPDSEYHVTSGMLLPVVDRESVEGVGKILPKFIAAADQGKLTKNRQKVMAKQVTRMLFNHGATRYVEWVEN